MTAPTPPLNYSTVTYTVLSNTRDNSSKQDYRNYSGIYHRHDDDMASVAKKKEESRIIMDLMKSISYQNKKTFYLRNTIKDSSFTQREK